MSASTSPDNIIYPISTDAFGPLETVFAALATSVQTALNGTKTYRTTDHISLNAITGMASGALATVIEGGASFSYDGTVWQQKTEALFSTTGIRDTAYAKVGGVYRVNNAKALVAGVHYEWFGSIWASIFSASLQLDTTNSIVATITQTGSGKVTGNNTIQVIKNVNFPIWFSAIPRVTISASGYQTPSSAFTNGGGSISTNYATVGAKTATSFSAVQNAPSGTLGSTIDYYFDWIAIGPA